MPNSLVLSGEDLEHLYSPEGFYEHGDNPALKRYMELAVLNNKGADRLDLRTYFIDKSKRFLYARNWDDFMQRDLKCLTFSRSFAVFTAISMGFYSATAWLTRLMPVGKNGIKLISQTSFYHNFGPIGAALAFVCWGGAAYVWWKTAKFTTHKFYRHVLMGDRNWMLEAEREPAYGEYYFSDSPWASEQSFPVVANIQAASIPAAKPTYKGYLQELV